MAETGHLVFGTLHTSTAPSTVDRVIDQFPAEQQNQIRAMLAESLKGVIAQTLLKTKDGKGRRAALEILLVNNAVSANIRDGKTHQIPLAMQTGRKLGMISLNQAMMKLVEEGIVSAEEAYAKAVEKDSMVKEFERLKIPFTKPTAESPSGKGKGKKRPGASSGSSRPRPGGSSPSRPPGGSRTPPGGRPGGRPAAAAAAGKPTAGPKKKKGWFG
jgi:hypothetical protein